MASQQKRRSSRRSAAGKKKSGVSAFPVRLFSWVLMTVFFFFSLGVLGYVVFFQTVQAAEMPVSKTGEQSPGPIFEEPNPPEDHKPVPDRGVPVSVPPKISIIIDDMGYHRKEGDALLAIPYPLTFSFLPYAPNMQESMEKAYQNGRTVLLHLPMQPKSDKWDAGEGALLVGEHVAELKQLLETNLQRVQYATGVNNHMGSLFTEQIEPMREVMAYLKDNGLFWVDSFTTAKSVGYSLAHEMGVKATRRHVFLDNQQQVGKICEQLDKLVIYAEEKGRGVGIGHPYPQTVEALLKCLPKYDSRVVIVGVNELVD